MQRYLQEILNIFQLILIIYYILLIASIEHCFFQKWNSIPNGISKYSNNGIKEKHKSLNSKPFIKYKKIDDIHE